MRNCKRCRGEVSWTNDTIVLRGHFSVHLCNDCSNEWHKVFVASPLCEQSQMLKAREQHFDSLAIAGAPVEEEAWRQLMRDKSSVESQCFTLAEAFCQPLPITDDERRRSRDALTAAGFRNVSDK